MRRKPSVPRIFARVHPRYGTPVNAIAVIGLAGFLAPFLGRQALVWFVDAGTFGLMIAYAMVTWSFLVLRRREPGMERPFRVPAGRLTGSVALLASLVMASLYLPTT